MGRGGGWLRGVVGNVQGEWRRITCIISRGEERSPSPIMVCAVSCTLGLRMSSWSGEEVVAHAQPIDFGD